MSNYTSLKASINANIKQNGNQEITGQILNSVLNAMVNTLGAGYQFAGVATPASNPGTPDAKVFYIANGKGIYTNFGGIDVTEDEVVILYLDSAWHKVSTGIALKSEIPDISGKADKSTTLAGYGIGDAYTKSEVDAALDGKQDKMMIFTETAGLSSYSINPNMLTKLGTLASNVTLSLNTASEEAGVVNVYDIIFATPTTAPSITWPEGISWVGGAAPSIAGGKTYEVSIIDNLAILGEY